MFPDTENHQEAFYNTRKQSKYFRAPLHDLFRLKLSSQESEAAADGTAGLKEFAEERAPRGKRCHPEENGIEEATAAKIMKGRSHHLSFPEKSAARVLASPLQMFIPRLIHDLIN